MKNGLPFTILVVDDDEDDRLIIDKAFQEIGYEAEVKKFMDGNGLLKYMEEIDPSIYPSVIVLDNSLPELGLSRMLIKLKSSPSYKNIPVVIYSTSISPAKRAQLLSLGAYACIEKGTTTRDVIEVVKDLKNIAESHL